MHRSDHGEPAAPARPTLGRAADAGAPAGANDLGHEVVGQFIAHNFARLFRDAKNRFRSLVGEGDLVITEHRLSSRLPDGRPYVNDCCFAYQVRDGQVVHIREDMDTRGGWAQVFGDGEPKALLAFAEG